MKSRWPRNRLNMLNSGTPSKKSKLHKTTENTPQTSMRCTSRWRTCGWGGVAINRLNKGYFWVHVAVPHPVPWTQLCNRLDSRCGPLVVRLPRLDWAQVSVLLEATPVVVDSEMPTRCRRYCFCWLSLKYLHRIHWRKMSAVRTATSIVSLAPRPGLGPALQLYLPPFAGQQPVGGGGRNGEEFLHHVVWHFFFLRQRIRLGHFYCEAMRTLE